MAQREATLLLKIKEVGSATLDKLQQSFDAIKQLGVAAFVAISAVVYKSIEAYKEQEQATNKLNQTLIQQGIYSKELSQEYQNLSGELQKVTTFADEAILSAQAQLQAYLGQTKVTRELTMAVLDFATAQGTDLKTASDLVGKSIATGTNALSRYGVEVNTSAEKGEKLTQVVGALNNRFGGQAQAAAQGYGGLQQLANAIGDVLEVIGQQLQPVVILITDGLKNLSVGLSESANFSEKLGKFLMYLSHAGNGVILIFDAVGKVIGTVLAGALGSVVNVVQGNFKKAWEDAKNVVKFSVDDMTASAEGFAARSEAIDKAFYDNKEANRKLDEERTLQSNVRKQEIQTANDQILAEKELEKQQLDLEKFALETEMLTAREDEKLAIKLKALEKEIQDETNFQNKKALVQQKAELLNLQRQSSVRKQQEMVEQTFAQNRVDILSGAANLVTALSGRESKIAFMIQKAAALAQAYVSMNVGAANALATVPYPANFAAAEQVRIAGALNIGAIAATAIKGLATGGIVPATPGGSPFILGEGGRSEAVVPLPDNFDPDQGLGGGGLVINFNGPVMGDPAQAQEFAKALDRELLSLRRSNQSLAFDSSLI